MWLFHQKGLSEAVNHHTVHGCSVWVSQRIIPARVCVPKSEFYSPKDTPLLYSDVKDIRESLRTGLLQGNFDLTLLKYDPGHGCG